MDRAVGPCNPPLALISGQDMTRRNWLNWLLMSAHGQWVIPAFLELIRKSNRKGLALGIIGYPDQRCPLACRKAAGHKPHYGPDADGDRRLFVAITIDTED